MYDTDNYFDQEEQQREGFAQEVETERWVESAAPRFITDQPVYKLPAYVSFSYWKDGISIPPTKEQAQAEEKITEHLMDEHGDDRYRISVAVWGNKYHLMMDGKPKGTLPLSLTA